MPRRPLRGLIQGATLALVLACGGDAAPDPEGQPDARPAVTLGLDRSTVNLFVGDTARVSLSGLTTAQLADSVVWYASDPAIVTVDARDGVFVGRTEGATRVWARFGADSISTIAVVESPGPLFVQNPDFLFFDALGDQASIELISVGRLPLPEGDLSEYCQAVDPTIVEITAGPSITSRGNGLTYVRCEIDQTIDSTEVRVQQIVTRVSIGRSQLRAVGLGADSLPLTLGRVDRLGAPVASANVRWRSLNTQILLVDSLSGVVRGNSLGSARIVGAVGNRQDTVRVQVAAMAVADEPTGLRPPEIVGVDQTAERPEDINRAIIQAGLDPDEPGAEEDQPDLAAPDIRLDAIRSAVMLDRAQAAPRRRASFGLEITPMFAIADHRLIASADPRLNRTTGPLFGIRVRATLAERIHLIGEVLVGDLDQQEVQAFLAESFTAVRAVLSYTAQPWLDLQVAGESRSDERGLLGRNRWTTVETGGEVYQHALDGVIRGHVRFAFVPLVDVSSSFSTQESPSFGTTAGAGVQFRSGRFTAGAQYDIQRFDFPGTRSEQTAMLRVNVGLVLGGR